MLTHTDVWRAIDRLAERHGLSTSGLARRAGLDPTTFNKSKRATPDGRLRWPSTESIAKVLDATGASLADLVGLTEGARPHRRIKLLHLSRAPGEPPFDAEGKPAGGAWDEIEFPDPDDPNAYALEITGGQAEPVFRDGDVIVVAPSLPPRRGDRVLVRCQNGEMILAQLIRQTATRLDLRGFHPDAEERGLDRDKVAWVARIRWASQ